MSLDEVKFFGEWVPIEENNPESKEEAKKWLEQWKKYLLIKLNVRHFEWDYLEQHDQWIEQEAKYMGPFSPYATLALKIAYVKKLPCELGTSESEFPQIMN